MWKGEGGLGSSVDLAGRGLSTVPNSVRVPIRIDWIYSPLGLMLVVSAPMLIGSLLLPQDSFPSLFGQQYALTPWLRSVAVVYFLVLLIVLAIPKKRDPRGYVEVVVEERDRRWIDAAVKSLTIITFGAYAIWFLLAVVRGFRPAMALALISGNQNVVYELKSAYFSGLSGVTTWMQVGALLVPLAVFRSRSGGKSAARLIGMLFFLSSVRAFLNSERLAAIEIALSSGIALCMFRKFPLGVLRRRFGTAIVAVSAWAGLLLLFGSFEYFRSWANQGVESGLSFPTYIVRLFIGYYATALNNAAFDWMILGGVPHPRVLFVGSLYDSILGSSPLEGQLRWYGIETFNNRSGLLAPLNAFGFVGGLLIMLAMGLFYKVLVGRLVEGSVISACLYCALSVSLLEIVRIFYLGSSRILPVVVVGLCLVVSKSVSDARLRVLRRE